MASVMARPRISRGLRPHSLQAKQRRHLVLEIGAWQADLQLRHMRHGVYESSSGTSSTSRIDSGSLPGKAWISRRFEASPMGQACPGAAGVLLEACARCDDLREPRPDALCHALDVHPTSQTFNARSSTIGPSAATMVRSAAIATASWVSGDRLSPIARSGTRPHDIRGVVIVAEPAYSQGRWMTWALTPVPCHTVAYVGHSRGRPDRPRRRRSNLHRRLDFEVPGASDTARAAPASPWTRLGQASNQANEGRTAKPIPIAAGLALWGYVAPSHSIARRNGRSR